MTNEGVGSTQLSSFTNPEQSSSLALLGPPPPEFHPEQQQQQQQQQQQHFQYPGSLGQQQQHQHQHQHHRQLPESQALPSLRSSINFSGTRGRDHHHQRHHHQHIGPSNPAATQQQPQRSPGRTGGIPVPAVGALPPRQSSQLRPLSFPQSGGGSGSSSGSPGALSPSGLGGAAGFYSRGGERGTGTHQRLARTLPSPFSGGGSRVIDGLDIGPSSTQQQQQQQQQFSVAALPNAAWPPSLLSGYGTMSMLPSQAQDSAPAHRQPQSTAAAAAARGGWGVASPATGMAARRGGGSEGDREASPTSGMGGTSTRPASPGSWVAPQAQRSGSSGGGGGVAGGSSTMGGTGSGQKKPCIVQQHQHPQQQQPQAPFTRVAGCSGESYGGGGLPQPLLPQVAHHSPRAQQQQQQQHQQQQQQWGMGATTNVLARSVTAGGPWPVNRSHGGGGGGGGGTARAGLQQTPTYGWSTQDSSSRLPQPSPDVGVMMARAIGGGAQRQQKAGMNLVGGGATVGPAALRGGGFFASSGAAASSSGPVSLLSAPVGDFVKQSHRVGKRPQQQQQRGRELVLAPRQELAGQQGPPSAAAAAAVAAINAAAMGDAGSREWSGLRTTIPFYQGMLKIPQKGQQPKMPPQQQHQLQQQQHGAAPASPPVPVTVSPLPSPRFTPIAPMIPKQQPAAMPPPTPPPPPPPTSAVPKGVSTGGKGEGGKAGGAATRGNGGGGGAGRGLGRRGVPTKFLSILYDMLVEGNPQVWWERETGSVVIEDPQLFEAETMPLFFADPKVAGFLRQLAFYGFKKPGRSVKEQGRYQHPECRWKDVSCVKSLLTKKAYDLRRLEKAIRDTSAVTGPDGSPCGDGGRAGSVGAVGQGEEGDAAEVERTELEVAAEATVVRGKSVGRQVRKELRQMMSRSQLGCWQVDQTAKLMMKIMRLNAKLAEGLRQCRARGGPPVLRRYNMNSPALAKVRLENARLRRRVRRLEDEAERRGLPLTAH